MTVLRQVAIVVAAIVTAVLATTAVGGLSSWLGWEPRGADSIVFLILMFGVFGLVGAAVYTALNDGPSTLRVLFPRTSRHTSGGGRP